MTKSRALTVLLWNFERNGAGNPQLRLRGHEFLAGLGPDLVLRQEMWGADANGSEILYEGEQILGLRGWLGPGGSTAVFADPGRFQPVREWPAGPMWVQPPTSMLFRYVPAGADASPISVVSYHLNYASASLRQVEAEWLSTCNDKRVQLPNGKTVRVPVIAGGDNNSYPVPSHGELPLPVLEKIPDRPHRLHRSALLPDGTHVMDARPDTALRLAGLEDVARFWHTHGPDPESRTGALNRTVTACDTHGPDSRIDRIYLAPELLPAVLGVDVIEVDLTMSDHHVVRLRLCRDTLADVLRDIAGAGHPRPDTAPEPK